MTEFVKAASKNEIPDNGVKVVEISGQRIALCHSQGGFYAIADLCSHDNAPLDQGELCEGEIECPRHGARFDIKTGKALCLPAVLPVPTYPVEVRGEEIWIGSKANS